jgi:uncharacterized protein
VSVFVDTSAIFAVLDAADVNHEQAARQWLKMLEADERLFTSNYVILELSALLQNRIGLKALKAFHDEILPMIHVLWVTEQIHQAAASALFVADRRHLSLVDCVNFELMRSKSISVAFTFDRNFRELGFTMVP